jgi:hypothetical protein
MGRNFLLNVTVGLLAATLSVALPNLRVEIPGAEEEPVASETIASPRPTNHGTAGGGIF